MSIIIVDQSAFVRFNHKHMICIGTKVEFDQATPDELCQMIRTAVAVARYNSILNGREYTRN